MYPTCLHIHYEEIIKGEIQSILANTIQRGKGLSFTKPEVFLYRNYVLGMLNISFMLILASAHSLTALGFRLKRFSFAAWFELSVMKSYGSMIELFDNQVSSQSPDSLISFIQTYKWHAYAELAQTQFCDWHDYFVRNK